MPFNQSMTVPLELALKQTDDGPRLTFAPAKELQSLRAHTHEVVSSATKELIQSPDSPNPLRDVSAELVELEIEFKPDAAKRVLINVRGVEIVYHAENRRSKWLDIERVHL